MLKTWKMGMAAVMVMAVGVAAEDKIKVVAALPNLRSIAEQVGGDQVEVTSIAVGYQDAHFVDPKPSFMTLLRDADLLLVNGLELEIGWIPPLVQGSRNPNINQGSSGYVDCSAGVPVVEVPSGATRAEGDVHPLGNPHYLLDPMNAKIVAKTIADAFARVRPGAADAFAERCKQFCKRIDTAMFGEALVDAVGGSKLCRLLDSGELWDFLAKETVDGQPLATKLGGWLARIAPARGKKVITYHKSFSYFANRFGVVVAEYVEPKPGIQPSASHLFELVKLMTDNSIKLIIRFPYNEAKSTELLAAKTGGKAIVLPTEVGGGDGTEDYFKLMDKLTGDIGAAFAEGK